MGFWDSVLETYTAKNGIGLGSVQDSVSGITLTDSEDITSWPHSTLKLLECVFKVECGHDVMSSESVSVIPDTES